MARTCILRAFGLQMSLRLSLVLRLFCFALLCFVFRIYAFVEAVALRSVVLQYAGAPIATRVSFFFFFFFFGDFSFFSLEMSLFPSFFLYLSAFSLYGEYVVRSFFPYGVFSTL